MQVRKQQLELDMEQQTGSKSGKEYIKALYCHPDFLIYMQSTSWEMLGWKLKFSKERKERGGKEEMFKGIMASNFSSLVKTIDYSFKKLNEP